MSRCSRKTRSKSPQTVTTAFVLFRLPEQDLQSFLRSKKTETQRKADLVPASQMEEAQMVHANTLTQAAWDS
jgi:hypothetical protein